jgi:hypothetical protein
MWILPSAVETCLRQLALPIFGAAVDVKVCTNMDKGLPVACSNLGQLLLVVRMIVDCGLWNVHLI